MNKEESFEEYWGQNTTGQYGRIERVIAKQAWNHQRDKYEAIIAERDTEIKWFNEILSGNSKKLGKLLAEKDKEIARIKKAKSCGDFLLEGCREDGKIAWERIKDLKKQLESARKYERYWLSLCEEIDENMPLCRALEHHKNLIDERLKENGGESE